MVNVVVLEGNLVRNPEMSYAAGKGTAIARFTLAINEGYGDSKKVYYPRVVAFGKTAEFVEKYFQNGSAIAVTGKLTTGSYKNKEGNTIYTTDVFANEVSFVSNGTKKQGEQVDISNVLAAEEDIPEDTFEAAEEDIPF